MQLHNEVVAKYMMCKKYSSNVLLKNNIIVQNTKIIHMQNICYILNKELLNIIHLMQRLYINYIEKIKYIKQAYKLSTKTFNILSHQSLLKNNKLFFNALVSKFDKWENIFDLNLKKKESSINSIIFPLQNSLNNMDKKATLLETTRQIAYKSVQQQIYSLIDIQNLLVKETKLLNQTVNNPISRGTWGEMQLKRVVEISGILPYCDFHKQPTIISEKKEYRPDAIINLPNNRSLIIDSKAPLNAYLRSIKSDNLIIKNQFIKAHVEDIKNHILILSKKAYWKYVNVTPEFVILFLPGESFFCEAIMQDPHLIEFGILHGVILTAPTTLIAILKAMSHSWNYKHVSDNAMSIIQISQNLSNRIHILIEHFNKLGKHISNAVDAYNYALGSLDNRILSIMKKIDYLSGENKKNICTQELKFVDKLIKISKI